MIKSLQSLMGVARRTADRTKISLTNSVAVVDTQGKEFRIHDVVWNAEKRRWEIRITEE